MKKIIAPKYVSNRGTFYYRKFSTYFKNNSLNFSLEILYNVFRPRLIYKSHNRSH